MFRKIHSKRDPEETLLGAVRKEFGGHFDKVEAFTRTFLERHPKTAFIAMVALLGVSMAFSFTAFTNRAVVRQAQHVPSFVKKASGDKLKTLSDGFGSIMRLSATLTETMALKNAIDSLLAKKNLSSLDSARLENALDKLQQINNRFKHPKNSP